MKLLYRINIYLTKNIYNKSLLKDIIVFLTPRKLRGVIKRVINLLNNNERVISFSKLNKGITIYVIRGHNAGLYSIIHSTIGYINYALSKDYIPVVDFENYETFYKEVKPVYGYTNVWEYYFRQPRSINLDIAYKSNSVILSPMGHSKDYPGLFDHIVNNDVKKIMEYNNIFKNFVKYNSETEAFIEQTILKTGIVDFTNILAVYIRGTDYKEAWGHHQQPTIEEFMIEINTFLNKYEIFQIFISTEETETLNELISEFGDLIVYQDRPRIMNFNQVIPTPKHNYHRDYNQYKSGLEYLTDIELCSRSNYFICGVSNGSVAIIEKNGLIFKDTKVIYKGIQYQS